MKAKIEMKNVTVGYLTETIIRNLTLAIGSGELVGVFGPNGAGKTTLLCAINGLAVMRGGKVFLDGKQFTLRTGAGLRKKMGFVPQHFEIDPRLPVSAREVVLMGRYGKMGLLRFPGAEEHRLLAKLTHMFGISHVIDKPFGQLSGGEKKRVLIARALIKEPEVMLLDEIFAWLDGDMEAKLIKIIENIHHRENLTTLLVSHDTEVISRLCNRVIWMERGKIVFDGGKDDFLRRMRG